MSEEKTTNDPGPLPECPDAAYHAGAQAVRIAGVARYACTCGCVWTQIGDSATVWSHSRAAAEQIAQRKRDEAEAKRAAKEAEGAKAVYDTMQAEQARKAAAEARRSGNVQSQKTDGVKPVPPTKTNASQAGLAGPGSAPPFDAPPAPMTNDGSSRA